jgi:LysR family transcriptional activator of nhaA
VLNYNHLYYFHRVADAGSIARAAESLGVTQPTVSEQVKLLERALGVALFQRVPGGLRLTDAGQRTYGHTTAMFRAGERLMEELGAMPSDVPRTLRIAITTAASRAIASDFLLPVFSTDAFTPTVRIGEISDLLRELRGNELDLVLCENAPLASTLDGFVLSEVHRTLLTVVAPPTLHLMADWSNAGMVQYRPSSVFRWDVETYLDARGLRPRLAGETDDALLMLELAWRGGFIAAVPRGVARDVIAARRLQMLDTITPMHAGLFALHADAEGASLARRAVELLVAYAAAGESEPNGDNGGNGSSGSAPVT